MNDESLKKEISRTAHVCEDVSIERAKMLVAQSAYLRAVRLHRNHSTETHKNRMSELHNEYNKSCANFSDKINESIQIHNHKESLVDMRKVDDSVTLHPLVNVSPSHITDVSTIQNTNLHIPEDINISKKPRAHIEDMSNISIIAKLRSELVGYIEEPISKVLYEKDIPLISKIHEQIVEVVSKSGIGPTANETVAQFLIRAQESITMHTSIMKDFVGVKGLSIPTYQTHLYKTVDGEIVSFGGNFSARSMVAYEYLSTHHSAHVLIESTLNDPVMSMSSYISFCTERISTSLRPSTFIVPEQFIECVRL